MKKNLKDVVNTTWKVGVSLIGVLVLILLVRIDQDGVITI